MKWKRRKKLIEKRMQIKIAVYVAVSLLVVLVFSLLFTHATIKSIFPRILSTRMGSQIQAIQTRLLIFGVIYLVFAAFISILISHKIAGPIFKFKKEIKSMIETGDISKRIFLRKGDELKDLADLLNQLFDMIEASASGETADRRKRIAELRLKKAEKFGEEKKQ